jgi:hypothetical protein
MKKILRLLLVTCVLASCLNAEIIKVKGKGEIVYSSSIFKQGSAEERQAIMEAKKNAIKRYAADFEPARFELYSKNEAAILAKVDDFIVDYAQIDQQIDKTSKRYTVVIEASVNTSLIERELKVSSAAGTVSGEEKSNMVFIFVAREIASRKAFDEKKSVITSEEKAETANENVESSPNANATQASAESSKITKQTSGGSSEFKADAVTYQVFTASEVDSAVNAVLGKAGYETVDPADVSVDVAKFKEDFSTGNDISATTRTEAIKVMRENDVRYMAIANMDVGLPEKDGVTGMTRVYVTVTAKVTYIPPAPSANGPKKLPKTVASIAGKPYSGLGSNPQVARTNALNEAATKSATELTDQLRMKNIK